MGLFVGVIYFMRGAQLQPGGLFPRRPAHCSNTWCYGLILYPPHSGASELRSHPNIYLISFPAKLSFSTWLRQKNYISRAIFTIFYSQSHFPHFEAEMETSGTGDILLLSLWTNQVNIYIFRAFSMPRSKTNYDKFSAPIHKSWPDWVRQARFFRQVIHSCQNSCRSI